MPGLLAADKFYFSETVRSPFTKKSPEEVAKFYLHYGQILFEAAGLSVEKDVFARIIRRWPELSPKMHFVLYEDVLTTIEGLKRDGFIVGLVTNATKQAIAVCEKLGLARLLDVTMTSEEAGVEKPDSKIFKLALEKAGVKSLESMHVGDQYEIDVVGARAAGIKPVLLDRYDLFPDVRDCPIIHGLGEVRSFL
jgi:HAD superfamily hydrolase (TIGR01549 family)